jgi:hypothetical protein
LIKYIMPTFITPYSGTAELTASNGLTVSEQGLWRFSQPGYNDGATFGLSLTHPSPLTGGTLSLAGQGWTIAVIGNTLTSYTDPDTSITYPASQCRITVTGQWVVVRQQNSNSFNGQGITYGGQTTTDQGGRSQGPYLLTYQSALATYVIQGSAVTGGAQDTFTGHDFTVTCTETATSDNSNREFQSNTIIRPTWNYTYAKSWQTAP